MVFGALATIGTMLLAPGAGADATPPAPAAAATTAGGFAILPAEEPLPAFRAPATLGLSVVAKVGYHSYSGWHWRGNDARAYSGPALEASALYRIRERYDLRIDAVAAAGYYGGSHCEPDSTSSCVTNRFSSLYLDAGARLTWKARPAVFLYGEAGAGTHYSDFRYSVPGGDPNYTNSGGGRSSAIFPSAHALAGVGLLVRGVLLFGEGKLISADGVLPAKSGSGGFYNNAIPISMGGEIIFVGAQLRM